MNLLKCSVTAMVLAVSAGSTSAMAAKYGSAGCGLGSIVIGPGSGFSQVFAATTNGTSNSQTFGISTGTSNCEASGAKIAHLLQQEYLNSNLATLAKEASQGGGETLEGFAQVFGCPKEDQLEFGSLMQTRYAEIFGEPGTEAILAKSRAVLQEDRKLAQACTGV